MDEAQRQLRCLVQLGKLPTDTAANLYEQYVEDEEEYSEATALEKLEQALDVKEEV